jgi:SMI1 / KNR4 family (SUKH-1)
MTVEELKKIDYAGIETRTGDMILGISDHLPWDEQEGEHLMSLQDKLNAYLTVIETGELYTELPRAVGRKIVGVVMGKFPLSEEAKKFYRLAGKFIEDLGFSLRFTQPGSE